MRKINYLIIILIFPIIILGQIPHYSGNVSGVWDSDTIYVDGNITIPINEELTIRPNTYVYFSGEYLDE